MGMTSVNPHYTFNYSQPEEYRFSHDSVFLAREVFKLTRGQNLENAKVLDLCAGSGIVGLDFLFHRAEAGLTLPALTDFLEVQQIYLTHFELNTAAFKSASHTEARLQFIKANYEILQNSEYTDTYNLILCNPPYFRPDQGKLSDSEFKNRCRFFLDSDFENLVKSLENCAAPEAQIYILLNSLEDHGINIENEIQRISQKLTLKKIGLIRSTDFWLLQKRPGNLSPR